MTDISAQPDTVPTIQEDPKPEGDKLKASSPKEDKPSKKDKKSKKEKKSKKHRSKSRSESESTGESKSRSRDRNDKKRSKKHKKHRRRSRSSDSESSSRSRSRSHRRRSSGRRRRESDRDRGHRDRGSERSRHDRDHNRGHDRRRRESEKKDKDKDKDDGRSRTRSPHPLLKRTVQEAPVRPKIEEGNKSKMFWDGFQWVSKANATAATADPAALNQTKKMRRLVISNLPLHLGLGEREIGEFVTKFIIENYLNDEGNFQPVREVVVDASRNSATIELSSVEEASRLAKVESIKVLGSNCRVSKVSESKFGATTNVATLVVEAQRTAQAQAAALAAMSMIQKKDGSTSFTLSKVNVLGTASKILKVTNLVDPSGAMNDQQLTELLNDIGEEFGKIGKITDKFIVKQGKGMPGAEVGTVFITFENENVAEKAMNTMANKRYDGREIRVIFVDEETFQKSFAQLKN